MLQETPEEALAHRTAHGANVLHFLAKSKNNEILTMSFIAKLPKECLVQKDVYGRTPLHIAATSGCPTVLLPLLEATPTEVLLMEEDTGLCPLELALMLPLLGTGSGAILALIDAYVKNGIMEAKKEWRVVSPLHVALDRWNKVVVTALLACPQAKEWVLISDPVTGVLPIHHVIAGATMFARSELLPLLELMAPEDVVTPISGSGSTALHLALKKSDVVYGKLLLEAAGDAFDVDAVDTKGRSLLAVGLMMGSPTKGAFVKLLRHLLDMSGSHCPLTVLSWKAVTRFVDVSLVLSICRRYDSDYFVNTTPEDWEGGTTPLHCACYPVMAASPFHKGDDIEAYRRDLAALLELLPEWFVVVGKGGYTPLHCAVACGNAVAVELLLDLPSAAKAAEIALECDEPDHQHAGTPLEVAVRIAHASVVRMFLAMVPGIRSVPTTSGQSLSELVDSLHAGDSWTFAAVKAAFVPAVKSAAQ